MAYFGGTLSPTIYVHVSLGEVVSPVMPLIYMSTDGFLLSLMTSRKNGLRGSDWFFLTGENWLVFPGEKWLFYPVANNGKEVKYIWKYLEAAPSATDSPYYFGYYYKDGKLASCGATAYAIGNGRMTTSLLVNAMGDTARTNTKTTDTAVYAAKYADDYTCGGYDDWFLPSTHEIRQLYRSKTVTFNVGIYYMSSTEYSTNSESKICVNQAGTEKYVSRGIANAYVWPIRAFYYRTK